jgi:exonuclease III
MRIVSWNCNGALRKKLGALCTLDADIYVVQECEDPARSTDANYKDWAANYLWLGPTKNKGLAVFAKPEISLKQVDLDAGPLELFLPCIVNGDTALLAAWTRQGVNRDYRYIGQLWQYLQIHAGFLNSDKAILIGDLNSNKQWDDKRTWNHSEVVRGLRAQGLESGYHHLLNEDQGQETRPTFLMHRKLEKPYHIDYAFLSQALLPNAKLEIGGIDTWLEHSDHMPVVVDISG